MDDRQFYDSISSWLLDKLVIQADGVRMIQDAYLYLAMRAVLERATATNETLNQAMFEPTSFCSIVLTAQRSSALSAGRDFCEQAPNQANQIYDYMVQQLELLGQPLSWGAAPGEGVRLILGSEITSVNAQMPDTSNPDDVKLTSMSNNSTWILAASPGSFDPRCNSPNATHALLSNCSLVSRFNCSDGKTKCWDKKVETLIDNTAGGTILGVPAELWFPANLDVWSHIRGAITGNIADTEVLYGADTLALLEKGDTNLIPFRQLTDRTFWIPNTTTSVRMQDVALEKIPKFKNWKYNNPSSSFCTNIPDDALFKFKPANMAWLKSQCFVASNPVESKDDKARKLGTTGIHCTSVDFAGLFYRNCSDAGSNEQDDLSPTPYYCNVTLRDTLWNSFGGALKPSAGRNGTLTAGCARDRTW